MVGQRGARGHILIVDDDEAVRLVQCEALEDEGYRCTTAANGCEALRIAAAVRPNPILLHQTMPVLDGAGFLRVYQAAPGPHTPIIVSSAEHEPAADAPGVVAVLPRPFKLTDLFTLVERHATAPTRTGQHHPEP